MTSFKRDAGVSVSKSRRTIPRYDYGHERPPEFMGMIWQDEIIKNRKKREWVAFYAGCAVGAAILVFSYLFLIRLTGGVCS